jgi:hypothetical protein
MPEPDENGRKMYKDMARDLKTSIFEHYVDHFPEGGWLGEKEFGRVLCGCCSLC